MVTNNIRCNDDGDGVFDKINNKYVSISPNRFARLLCSCQSLTRVCCSYDVRRVRDGRVLALMMVVVRVAGHIYAAVLLLR